MSGVVVEDGVDRLVGGRRPLDGIEIADELLMGMALHAPAEDNAIKGVEGGEQGGRAVPLVIMGHGPAFAGLDRQTRLGAIECPCSCQGQACMGQLLSSLMVGEVNGRLGWVRAGLTIRGERAIGLQPHTLVFGRPRLGLDHDAAMRIGGEAPGGGPIL